MQEKASRTASLGAIGFMIVAVLFAAGSGILLSQVIQSTYSKEPVKPLVVAARDIPTAQPLVKEDLKVSLWPQSSIPRGAFADPNEIVKQQRVALIPLVMGESVLASHLSKPNSGIGIAPVLETNKRAMSIKMSPSAALSRLLYPGCLADILVTIKEDALSMSKEAAKEGRKMTTKIVLQAVKVLAVGWDIDPLTISRRARASAAEGEEGKASAGSGAEEFDLKEARGIVTVAVTPDEAETLAMVSREGEIDLVLRNPKDKAFVESKGATSKDFRTLTGQYVEAPSGAMHKKETPTRPVRRRVPIDSGDKKTKGLPVIR
jgi:pilus assembly protein CpaB